MQGSALRALSCIVVMLLSRGIPASQAQSPVTTGTVTGVVRDTAQAPVPLVRIWVGTDSARHAVTDPEGAFRLSGVPAGPQRAQFRRLGYLPASFMVLVIAGEELRLQVELAPVPAPLEPIEVTGSRYQGLELVGFYDRLRQRRIGILSGTLIEPEEIERRRATQVTRHLEGVPGIFLEHRGPWLVVPRGRVVTRRGARCLMAVFFDGHELPPDEVEFAGIDRFINSSDVAALEVYPSASGTPLRFQSRRLNNPCGSVVIWTKSFRPQPPRPPRDSSE